MLTIDLDAQVWIDLPLPAETNQIATIGPAAVGTPERLSANRACRILSVAPDGIGVRVGLGPQRFAFVADDQPMGMLGR